MKKPWSITTTTRNPYRLRRQLRILKCQFADAEWSVENQTNYHISLIQHRLYGYVENCGFSSQFLSTLTGKYTKLFTDLTYNLTYDDAKEIFELKNYKDPAMRGRQSLNPLKKFGFVQLRNNIIRITALGDYFLSDEYDLSAIFFRSLIKWQLPNPDSNHYKLKDGYDIKPFVGSLHLINAVNLKWKAEGKDPDGISNEEFALFAPTLINFTEIDKQAQQVIQLRLLQQGKRKQEQKEIFNDFQHCFASSFLNTNDNEKIKKLLNNLRDYGDNALRYFRLTNLIYILGDGYNVDLQHRRSVEIESLLEFDNAQSISFETKNEYLDYISDISQPKLQWETREKYIEIITQLLADIACYEIRDDQIDAKKIDVMQDDLLKIYIVELRSRRKTLQNESLREEAQDLIKVNEYISGLKNILSSGKRAILLEKLATLGLLAIDDALKIQPNYPVGDDNEPTFTAPANTPDIECFYNSFNTICEVTMLVSRDQWYNEGQPVMRHLRDFENKYPDKPSYCLFLAPKLHRDTINTFWNAIKYEYEGAKQKIIPLTITQFISILELVVSIRKTNRFMTHSEISCLYDKILASSDLHDNSNAWLENIACVISSWKESFN